MPSQFSILQWLLPSYQSMGRTSGSSWLNLPGRWGWSAAESIGPLNLVYILYTLPSRLHLLSHSTTTVTPSIGLFRTGLPITHEVMGLLYVIHYINRAIITPLFVAPSISPINGLVSLCMAVFQFMNSSSIAGWLCYDAQRRRLDPSLTTTPTVLNFFSLTGLILFILGLAGNISAEWQLFALRRGAAKRKAKSEGKVTVTYDKVYVIPEATGFYKHILYPHYSFEWVEWTGYWVLGGGWGLGWTWPLSAAAVFLVNEVALMTPRAVDGVRWYEKKFGKRAVGGRRAVIPGLL